MTAPRTLAWFHCFSGIAGDMALGSLLDAGADLGEVMTLLRRVPLSGWGLEVESVRRNGLACTRAVVVAPQDPVARTHAELADLVTGARLPERVRDRALAVFRALAEAEGAVHGVDPAAVHFHEVGGHDAVVDVVGTTAALEVLGVDDVQSSPVAVGTGTINSAHGSLPNPSPAVVRLLTGAPVIGQDSAVELTTPTGAALLAALASGFGPLPPLEVTATGFGAGAAEIDGIPNCTQVVVGRSTAGARPGDGEPVTVLETNLDDVTGEQLARAIALLLEAGAHDAWTTAVTMKKGRPGHTLHALCDPAAADAVRDVMKAATGTLGVRAFLGQRWPDPRETGEVLVAGEPIAMKVGPTRAKPEFDDVARVAEASGLPVGEVASRAEEAWRRRDAGPTAS